MPPHQDPKPSTLNSQLSTLSPQPSTLNSQLSTLNPQPSSLHVQAGSRACLRTQTPSPKLSTLNHQVSTLKPQLSTLNPQPSTLNPQPSTLNPQPSTLHPQAGSRACRHTCSGHRSSSSLLLSSLELSDTTIYEPSIRAFLGTASHSCSVIVLKLRTFLFGTALNLAEVAAERRYTEAENKIPVLQREVRV